MDQTKVPRGIVFHPKGTRWNAEALTWIYGMQMFPNLSSMQCAIYSIYLPSSPVLFVELPTYIRSMRIMCTYLDLYAYAVRRWRVVERDAGAMA